MRHTPLLAAALVLLSIPAAAQTHERVDLNSANQPANSWSGLADMSEDARFIVFVSTATNLGGSTAPGVPDVFLRDRALNTTTAITADTAPGTDRVDFVPPRISGDGSLIVYTRGGGTTPAHALIHDPAAGVTTPLILPGLVDVRISALNRSGAYAALTARATPTAPQQVYRLHIPSGALVLCSRSMTGLPAGGSVPDIDDGGKLVAFTSGAPDIVPNDTNGTGDVFVLDIPGNAMMCASVDASGVPARGLLYALSGIGRHVLFEGNPGLASGGVPATQVSALVRDLRLATTTLASQTTHNVQIPSTTAGRRALSSDGSMAAFVSGHPTSITDLNTSGDLFVHDALLGTLLPVTIATVVPIDFQSAHAFSADGRMLLYQAVPAPTPVEGSQTYALYMADFGARCSTSGYCTSLPNSTGAPATIGTQGDASRELNNLVIAGVGLPDTANAMLVSGTSPIDPGTPFGNGLMCIGGTFVRHGIHVATGGVILDHQDVNSPEYAGVNPGDTRYYQIVYRDPPAGGALFNTTDAVAVTFCW